MKPFGYVILIALFSLGPLLFLAKYLPGQSNEAIDEELKVLGAVMLEEPVSLDLDGFVDHERRPFGQDQFAGKWSFLYLALALFFSSKASLPSLTFRYSIVYLGLLFLFLVVDHYYPFG